MIVKIHFCLLENARFARSSTVVSLFVRCAFTLTAENKLSKRNGVKSRNFFNGSHWLIFVDKRNYSFIKLKTTDFLSFCYVPSMDVEQERQNVTFIRVINKINSGCDD